MVGVIDNPDAVDEVLRDLQAAGFDDAAVSVLAGDLGVQRIDQTGERHRFRGRLIRELQVLGDYERTHTQRHVEELEAGRFVVLVGVTDDASKKRVRDILGAHGGHFIYYYSRWTATELLP